MKNKSNHMFVRYGPNALKVGAFIGALEGLSSGEFALRGPWLVDQNRLDALFETLRTLRGERAVERANAYLDSIAALKEKDSEIHREVVANVAALLVLEDRLTLEENNFLSLALVDPIVPLKLLYNRHRKEDHAIEDFCEQCSRIDGQNVYVKSRPDSRGQNGKGLLDFIVSRGGEEPTVEHTFINTYQRQVFYESLWRDYIKPSEVRQRLKQAYPKSRISVYIPEDAFKKESEAKKFNWADFIRRLIEAIERTPRGRYGRKQQTHNIPFPVVVSNDDPMGFPGCYVIAIAPTNDERIETDLKEEISKAIIKKRKKLQEASKRGESTILLLDSDDSAFVNHQILADAFAKAVGSDLSTLEGIDEVYIQHRGGTCWIVPVKLGDRVYPNLAEFEDYRRRQWELL